MRGVSPFPFVANHGRLWLFILAHNLEDFLWRLALPRAVKDWPQERLTTLMDLGESRGGNPRWWRSWGPSVRLRVRGWGLTARSGRSSTRPAQESRRRLSQRPSIWEIPDRAIEHSHPET